MIINNEKDMIELGEKIGRLMKYSLAIELIGDIGAGKTTLVKGIARGMGIVETVQSPTFTLNRVYQSPSGIGLRHYDFYRLTDAGILHDEINESFNLDETIVVVEWASTVGAIMPEDRLSIEISTISEFSRDVKIKASGPRSRRLMKELNCLF